MPCSIARATPAFGQEAILPVASFARPWPCPCSYWHDPAAPDKPVPDDSGDMAVCRAVAFQIVTLPVEYNASRRTGDACRRRLHYRRRSAPGENVLNAAALTQAAAAVALTQLLRLLVLRGSRRD